MNGPYCASGDPVHLGEVCLQAAQRHLSRRKGAHAGQEDSRFCWPLVHLLSMEKNLQNITKIVQTKLI